MLFVNSTTKERFNLPVDLCEAFFLAAYQCGWKPTGTTQSEKRYAAGWVGARASYLGTGAVIGTSDAAELAVALGKAWDAICGGAARLEGEGLEVTDRRLVTGYKTYYAGHNPVASIQKSEPVVRGALWAAAQFFGIGGPVLIGKESRGDRDTAVTVKMLSGVSWEHGRTLGKGDVVSLPIDEAALLVGQGRAEGVKAA